MGIDIDASVVRGLIGLPLEDVVERLLIGVPRDKVEEFIRTRRELVERYWRSRVKLFPDVKAALNELKRSGYLLAVASSSRQERIVEFLEHFGVIGYFDYVSGVKPGVRGKPAPDVILSVLEALNKDPSEAVYVGDKEVDCVASSIAGVDFILIERAPLSSIRSCRPKAKISTLLELPTILKRY